MNVNYGTCPNDASSLGTFSAPNFDFVNINLTGAVTLPELGNFYFGGLEAIANADAAETMTINASLAHAGGEKSLLGMSRAKFLAETTSPSSEGRSSLPRRMATFTDTGTLDITGTDEVVIGVTNASTIKSTTAGAFIMSAPDDVDGIRRQPVDGPELTTPSARRRSGSLLQGTLTGAVLRPSSPARAMTASPIPQEVRTSSATVALTSSMIGGGGNTIHFGEFVLNDVFATTTLLSMSSRSTQVTLPTSGSGEPRAMVKLSPARVQSSGLRRLVAPAPT